MKVESGVEMPPAQHGSTSTRYPWATMKVGDSFFVNADGDWRERRPAYDRVRAAASQRGRRHGEIYAVRAVKGGLRCWRVE